MTDRPTKLDSLDDIAVPGFRLYTKNRVFKKKASGGIAALVSDRINKYIEELEIKQQDTVWLKLKGNFNKKDLLLCLACIPPEKSVYSNISIFTDIEDELNNLRSKNSHLEFCLLGDFNARTGVHCDFIDMSADERENNNGDEKVCI